MYQLLIVLHLLGASIWIGGHIVLSTVILPRALKLGDAAMVRDFESGFERIGLPALLVQAVTGVWLAYYWLPRVAVWFRFDTTLSRLIAIKLLLLAVTVALALHARLRLIPRLDGTRLRPLGYHIIAVTLVSILFLLAGVGIRTHGLL